MAQTASTQNSKWTTAKTSGNVYTKWDSNVIVKDDKGTMVQLNKHLKQEDQYEEKIGGVWYKARNSDGTWLIYAENEQRHQERLAKQPGGGGKGKDDWYRIVDVMTEDDPDKVVYRLTQEKWSPWGKSFREATQVVNGKLVYGLVKREKVQPGGSPAAETGPAESAPPV